MKTLFDLCGGATLAPAFIGIIEEAYNAGLRPDAIVSVSVNSLLAFHIAMGARDKKYIESAKDVALSIKPQEIWRVNPYNKKGKFTPAGFFRMIGQNKSFGIQDTRPLFKSNVSEQMFETYKTGVEKGLFAEIWISTWDWKTKKNIFHQASQQCYHDLVEIVEASAHIDTITDPVWVNGWGWQYDSGRIDQNAGHKFLTGEHLNYYETLPYRRDFTQVFSIYPRKDFIESREPKTWFVVNESNLKAAILEGSKGDEAQMELFCLKNGLTHKKVIFAAPDVPTYETDRQVMNFLYSSGKAQALSQLA